MVKMTNNLIFIESSNDLEKISHSEFNKKNTTVWCFEIESHKKLVKMNIDHFIADEFLNSVERENLFQKGLDMIKSIEKIKPSELEFENVNLLQLHDKHELHSYLMKNLIKFVIIKKILTQNKISKIICNKQISNICSIIINSKLINFEIFENENEEKMLWDDIVLKYNFGKIPLSINISKKKYLRIKKIVEKTLGYNSKIWLEDKPLKKSIILLEFNTELFEKLLILLRNFEGSIILVNQRRPAFWNKKTLKIVKESNCKILHVPNLVSSKEIQNFSLINDYKKKINKYLNTSNEFNLLFTVENVSFWKIIKNDLIRSYENKIENFIYGILVAKKIFQKMNPKLIISLNEIGESERIFLEFNNKKIPSFLLEHGFIDWDEKTKLYHSFEYNNFNDRILVWGDYRKKQLINEEKINPSKIITSGSPRHDNFFNTEIMNIKNDTSSVLIAPNPITEFSGLGTVELEIKFENVLKQIFLILNESNKIHPFVKLHGTQLKHNLEIKNILQKINHKIPIILTGDIIKIINQSNLVIVITPESFGTSTMILEAMILGKPVLNIILDDKIPNYNFQTSKSIFSILFNDEFNINLKKFLFDKNFQNELLKNQQQYLDNFLNFKGKASERLVQIINDETGN